MAKVIKDKDYHQIEQLVQVYTLLREEKSLVWQTQNSGDLGAAKT